MSCLHTLPDDPQVKVWGDLYQKDFDIDRDNLVGLFLPTFNSIDLIESCYMSLIRSMPHGYPFGITVVDGGSTDGTLNFLNGIVEVHTAGSIKGYDTTGLCKDTPNACIEVLLGKWDPKSCTFENEDRYGYICWIHTDMDFCQDGWLLNLVNKYNDIDNIGILGPETVKHNDPNRKGDFPGNVAPFIISVKVLKECYKKYGYFIDPKLWFCIGHCDWDMHRRFMYEMGYKSYITSDSFVRHPGAGDRVNLDKLDKTRVDARRENAEYYEQKWKTHKDPFSELENQRRQREKREQEERERQAAEGRG